MTIGWRTGGQRFLVVSHAVFIEERLIDQILGDHHPRQTRYQRRIGAGANRDPFIFTPGAGVGIARIDDDHPGIGFLPRLFKVVCHPAAAHPRFAGVIAEQHHQLAVFNIRWTIAVGPAAVGIIEALGNLRRRVIAIVVQITAAAVHQTGNQRFSWRPGTSQRAAERTGAVVQIDGFVAVFFNQPLHIAGDSIERLFPADLLEFPFPAFANALHRVLQAIRVIDAAAHRTPAQAGADLVQTVIVIVTGIIGFDVFNRAIHHVHAQRAAAAAVDGTGTPDHLLVGGCRRIGGMRQSGKG